MRISDWSSDVCSSDLYIVNGDPLNAAQQDIPILPILNMSPPNALGHELRVDPPAGTGFDLAALHGGGGDGASYFDALAENTPYDPANPPTAPARYEEHTSELQSLMRTSYAVFCLNTNKHSKRMLNNTKTN